MSLCQSACRCTVSALCASLSWSLLGLPAAAAQLTLLDGTVLRGTVENQGGVVMVNDGLRRVFFGVKRLAHVADTSDAVGTTKPFNIPQPLSGRSQSGVVENLVSIVKITSFDEFGRRIITVRDPVRGPVEIPQAITRIRPEYVQVQSLKYLWESRIATAAIPAETIEAVLRHSIDSENVDDRFRLARFFIAANWYMRAERELNDVERRFPAFAAQVQEARGLLEQLKARRRLDEIKLRRRAGQHSFAYQVLRNFKAEGAPGDVLTEVRELLQQYELTMERMQRARRELAEEYGKLDDSALKAKLHGPIEEMVHGLHVENLGRLDRFLESSASTAPEDRVALALSGWVAGSAFAQSDVDRALRLWEAREKIGQYLSEENLNRRRQAIAELKLLESLSVEVAAQIIKHLPPVMPGEVKPGKRTRMTIPGSGVAINYWVLLPAEYNPYHRYPVIIALSGRSGRPEREIAWWSGSPGFQASRNGYIVVVPEYVSDSSQGYRYDAQSHDAVLHCLVDIRRRFSVDSDRVFLSGHWMGADAAWDIGLSHPDLFAGVIPISGSPQLFCEHYWPNAEHVSFYVVEGQKDGAGPEQNRLVLNRMMARGHDALYVEYIGRGHENFSDELLRLFDWMSRKTRRKYPLKFSCRSARPTDNEFYWLSVGGYLPSVMMDPRVYDRKRIRPARLEGRITGTSNSIQLTLRGPTSADLWLSPEMIELGRPLTVRVNGSIKFRKRAREDLEVLLEDFRLRMDREKLFHARLSFPRL